MFSRVNTVIDKLQKKAQKKHYIKTRALRPESDLTLLTNRIQIFLGTSHKPENNIHKFL